MQTVGKIVWAEGLVLTQQHFQQWDLMQDARQLEWHRLLNVFAWGVDSIAWNTTSLINRKLELTRFKAIFPDGRLVDYRCEKEMAPSINLDHEDHEQQLLFVALADNQLVSDLTGYEQPQATPAWQASYSKVADLYDPARSEEVLLAEPNLLLLTESQLKDGMVILPVAMLYQQQDGSYDLDDSWLSCLIRLQRKTRPYELLQSLQQLLLHRIGRYQEKRLTLGDLSSFSSVELAGFMLQKDLATHLTDLTSMLEHQAHPHQAFLLLNRLIAQLRLYAGVTDEPHVYRHLDQISTLKYQVQEIELLLSELSYEQDVQLRLVRKDSGVLVTDEHNIKDFSKTDFYIALNKPGMDQLALDRFPHFCKVASATDIDKLLEAALPGMTLRYCKRIPNKIRQKNGREYFVIEKDGPIWHQAEQELSLAIFCAGEFTDADIELLAVEAG